MRTVLFCPVTLVDTLTGLTGAQPLSGPSVPLSSPSHAPDQLPASMVQTRLLEQQLAIADSDLEYGLF